jgi:hypothetical protein
MVPGILGGGLGGRVGGVLLAALDRTFLFDFSKKNIIDNSPWMMAIKIMILIILKTTTMIKSSAEETFQGE